MSFEGFNKIVKQATEISNYRSEDIFVLEHWMMKSAKKLRKMRNERNIGVTSSTCKNYNPCPTHRKIKNNTSDECVTVTPA